MEWMTEIDQALEAGFESFKQLILNKLQANEAYLEHFFWVPGGLQMTVLNYLIQQHQQKNGPTSIDLIQHIDFIINKTHDKNASAPIHQAIILGKLRLAAHLLHHHEFDINVRDKEGHTILALALAAKNKKLLKIVMEQQPNVHAASCRQGSSISFQPLHKAVLSDFGEGVTCLAKAGAQLDNPVGPLADTPLLLAARLGKIQALEALLQHPVEQLALEAENGDKEGDECGDKAIDALCRLFSYKPQDARLLQGVAMLLCNGAQLPKEERMVQLLAHHRLHLLKAIDTYLENRPDLVDDFVGRCHEQSALHALIYTEQSWGKAMRQLFGRPSAVGFMVERWLTRKYSQPTDNSLDVVELPAKAAVVYTGKESPLKLYAEFVRRYEASYKNQRLTNPWSKMRWMIAEGQCTWESVLHYAKTHPTSRTRIILEDMIGAMPLSELDSEKDFTLNML